MKRKGCDPPPRCHIPSTLRILWNMNVKCTWSNVWHRHDYKSKSLPHPNHKLAIEIGRWLTILVSRYYRLYHFCSYNATENVPHFVLKCPYITPLETSLSLFENVLLGSRKSFLQLDHQVDINLYLTKASALRHSRALVGVKPPWCTFNPIRALPMGAPHIRPSKVIWRAPMAMRASGVGGCEARASTWHPPCNPGTHSQGHGGLGL